MQRKKVLFPEPDDPMIIGSSGSGKSTFLRCINFLEKPSEGSIMVNNQQITLVRDKDGQLKVADKEQLRKKVLFPEPDDPMILITSPALAVNETPFSTSCSP